MAAVCAVAAVAATVWWPAVIQSCISAVMVQATTIDIENGDEGALQGGL